MAERLGEFLGWARHLAAGAGFWAIAGISVALAVLSLAAAAFVIVRWPAEQFVSPHAPPFWPHEPPWLRVLGLIGKNLAGAVLVLLGIVMSLPGVPGQGILVILIGLTLLDIPGKRQLERRLLRRPLISHAVNKIRARFGRPPLLEG